MRRHLFSVCSCALVLMLTGCAGEDGAAGADGATGAAGADGSDGAAGADGATGPAGMDGAPGAEGPAGPEGPAGMDGPQALTITGTVSGPSGPAANAVLILQAVTQDGESFATAGFTQTDANGAYSIDVLNVGMPGTFLKFVASTTEGEYSAFATGATQDINVQTDVVAQIVTSIIGSEQGRSISDFTPAEVSQSVTEVTAALAAANIDLADAQAVLDEALSSTGEAIADRSEGSITAVVQSSPIAVDPPDVLTTGTLAVDITDGNGEIWDITTNGEISDGTDDAYDTFFELSLDGNTDVNFGAGPVNIEDGNEYVLGPIVDGGGVVGIDVTRKIYVDTTGVGFARFIDSFTNTTAADITIDVRVGGNLGSDESNDIVEATSSNDTVLDATDTWLANAQDSDDPAVGFIFRGVSRAEKTDDDIDFFWDQVVVPAGATVNIVTIGIQRTNADAISTGNDVQALLSSPALYDGMTAAEYLASYNFQAPNIVGTAGGVAPNAQVTVTNDNTAETTDVVANSDGSFAAGLTLTTGDTVSVTTTWGRDDDIVVP